MGDEYPYGPSHKWAFNSVYNYLLSVGVNAINANILTAIGMAESSLDSAVVNNTPATGDFSVGIWQINYYGSLYAGRVAEFGTPEQLAQRGLPAQAAAARTLVAQSGYSPWSTYKSGAYKSFLIGGAVAAPQTAPGLTGANPNPAISPPEPDYSGTIVSASGLMAGMAQSYLTGYTMLANLKDGNPNA
jgi:Lysozyme like domain